MYRLSGHIQHYRWGSPTVIPELGAHATDEPAAELWMAAHSSAPARVAPDSAQVSAGAGDADFGRSLAGLISEDPRQHLGPQVAARYGATLPLLLKVLAVERSLSLQAHPSARQAEAGFAAENAAGIALDSPKRNYKDVDHKPEMIGALTPFEASVASGR